MCHCQSTFTLLSLDHQNSSSGSCFNLLLGEAASKMDPVTPTSWYSHPYMTHSHWARSWTPWFVSNNSKENMMGGQFQDEVTEDCGFHPAHSHLLTLMKPADPRSWPTDRLTAMNEGGPWPTASEGLRPSAHKELNPANNTDSIWKWVLSQWKLGWLQTQLSLTQTPGPHTLWGNKAPPVVLSR